MQWPPNYAGELDRRMKLEHRLTAEKRLREGALAVYARDPVAFISDCVWLYEPRNANAGDPVMIPVVLFERQTQFIVWLHERFTTKTSAPVEKSRDSGATWMSSAFAVWVWLFHPGSTVGFGSRKEILVDRAGDLQSIFEKVRSIVRNLPHYLKPRGFKEHTHSNYMRLLNPANEATIIGEAGDQIGRGGRTSIFFVDEAAFLERPALIEAALSATTDCRVDISTPCNGSLFNAWTANCPDKKFIFDIRDIPWHGEEWIRVKREELESKGLKHVFAQEFLRDGTAGLEGQLIPGEWVEAAVDACVKLHITPTGEKVAALDVADGGKDRSALTVRYGVEVELCKSRGDVLADGAGAWAYGIATQRGCQRLLYDNIGVGAGAAAALRGKTDVKIQGWNAAGAGVNRTHRYQGSRANEDMFANAKAQAWWALRDRFLETFKASRGEPYDADAIISLHPSIEEMRELKSELSQVTYQYNAAGKVLVNKAPDGHSSPNRADSVMIAFAPVSAGISIIGVFG